MSTIPGPAVMTEKQSIRLSRPTRTDSPPNTSTVGWMVVPGPTEPMPRRSDPLIGGSPCRCHRRDGREDVADLVERGLRDVGGHGQCGDARCEVGGRGEGADPLVACAGRQRVERVVVAPDVDALPCAF